jgi:diamine N-acetyltransferase
MKIEITQAHPENAEIIAHLGKTTFTETFGHLFVQPSDLENYLEYTFAVDKIRSGLSKPQNSFWLAWTEGVPVAYAKTKRNSQAPDLQTDKSLQLQKIYVLRDFLAHKIGFQLWKQVWQQAEKEQFNIIWLSVLATNERAIQFYQKLGFVDSGEHSFTIGSQTFDFIWLKKGVE